MNLDNLQWRNGILFILLAMASTLPIPWLVMKGLWLTEHTESIRSALLLIFLIAGLIGLLACLTLVALAFAVANLFDRRALNPFRGQGRIAFALTMLLILLVTAAFYCQTGLNAANLPTSQINRLP